MYTIGGYLCHHGILGQKWGIRRFQPYPDGSSKGKFVGMNKNGILTNREIKKYYDKNDIGKGYSYYSLNNKGRKYNKKVEKKIKRYEDSTRYNVSKVNKNFNKELENLDDISKKNNESFLRDREEFFKTGKLRGKKLKDWYDFKDTAADDWIESKEGKEEARIKKSLENMVREAAKQHPMYSKNYRILEEYPLMNSPIKMKNLNVGEEVVKNLMKDIAMEYRLKNNKTDLNEIDSKKVKK